MNNTTPIPPQFLNRFSSLKPHKCHPSDRLRSPPSTPTQIPPARQPCTRLVPSGGPPNRSRLTFCARPDYLPLEGAALQQCATSSMEVTFFCCTNARSSLLQQSNQTGYLNMPLLANRWWWVSQPRNIGLWRSGSELVPNRIGFGSNRLAS